MARRYHNPDLPFLGVDFIDALETGAGMAVVAVGNDKVVTPFVKGILPAIYANETVAKVADTASTILTGAVVSYGVGLVDRGAAKRVAFGAGVLATVKAVAIIIPGFFLNAGLPTTFTFFNPLAKKELPAPANGAQALALIGVGSSMGI